MRGFISLISAVTLLSSTLSYATPVTAVSSSKLSLLKDFLARYPEITYVTPSSTNYTVRRETYIGSNPAVPLAIVRPQNAKDVAALVAFAKSSHIDFVVRSGGHDLYGRSEVDGALTIDMRDINSVEATTNGSVAKLGGGVLMIDVATKLSKYGLATAFGAIGSVGYVGWSSYGGYGELGPNYGLGVDQIVGATVVNWKGEVVEASPAMLKGIRGAGGSFGVIVDLTIKVYPLEKILAGVILYNTTDIDVAFQDYARAYSDLEAQGLPSALGVQTVVLNLAPLGRVLGASLVWSSSDLETGRIWVNKIAALGKVAENTVAETTAPGWITGSSALVSAQVYGGGDRTVSIRKLTPEISKIIGRNVQKLPTDNGTSFSIHECRGPSAKPNSQSIFAAREPHFVLELSALVTNQANENTTDTWAATFREELLQSSPDNLLSSTYISLTQPGDTPVSKIYGKNYPTLLMLKHTFDPDDVFNLAIPRLNNTILA